MAHVDDVLSEAGKEYHRRKESAQFWKGVLIGWITCGVFSIVYMLLVM